MKSSPKHTFLWSIFLVALLSLSLAACGDDAVEDDGSSEGNTSVTSSDTSSGTSSSGTSSGESCIGVTPSNTANGPTILSTVDCPTCEGSDAPGWMLQDFQPQSCGNGKIYGLDSFKGKPTVVVLLSATCSYCQSQIGHLEQMRLELQLEGVDVNFAVVNLATTAQAQEEFTSRASFPLFQDNDVVDAWGLHGGSKDDFYLYDEDLKLVTFLPANGEVNTTLSTEDGYANLKNAVIALTQ